MKIETQKGEPVRLRDGGIAHYYTVGEGSDLWHMEVVFDADGNLDPECDANVEYAKNATKVWAAWAKFVEQKNEEGWA